MKENGLLVLNTDGGSRKMSYVLLDGQIVMTTISTSHKVSQIKSNPEVTIDLNDKVYDATLIIANNQQAELKKRYLAALPLFKRLTNKIIGRNSDTIIILSEHRQEQ